MADDCVGQRGWRSLDSLRIVHDLLQVRDKSFNQTKNTIGRFMMNKEYNCSKNNSLLASISTDVNLKFLLHFAGVAVP